MSEKTVAIEMPKQTAGVISGTVHGVCGIVAQQTVVSSDDQGQYIEVGGFPGADVAVAYGQHRATFGFFTLVYQIDLSVILYDGTTFSATPLASLDFGNHVLRVVDLSAMVFAAGISATTQIAILDAFDPTSYSPLNRKMLLLANSGGTVTYVDLGNPTSSWPSPPSGINGVTGYPSQWVMGSVNRLDANHFVVVNSEDIGSNTGTVSGAVLLAFYEVSGSTATLLHTQIVNLGFNEAANQVFVSTTQLLIGARGFSYVLFDWTDYGASAITSAGVPPRYDAPVNRSAKFQKILVESYDFAEDGSMTIKFATPSIATGLPDACMAGPTVGPTFGPEFPVYEGSVNVGASAGGSDSGLALDFRNLNVTTNFWLCIGSSGACPSSNTPTQLPVTAPVDTTGRVGNGSASAAGEMHSGVLLLYEKPLFPGFAHTFVLVTIGAPRGTASAVSKPIHVVDNSEHVAIRMPKQTAQL